MNLARIIFIFSLTLLAGNVSAQLDIRVTPTAEGLATLADLKKNPNTSVTLIQALAILKDPALRDAKGTHQETINIHLDAGIYRLNETLHLDAAKLKQLHQLSVAGFATPPLTFCKLLMSSNVENLHPCSLDTGNPCRYDDFCE